MNKSTMTPRDLENFLTRNDMTNREFAELLGLTEMAISHWIHGRRMVPPTTVKLIRLFDRQPKLMKDF